MSLKEIGIQNSWRNMTNIFFLGRGGHSSWGLLCQNFQHISSLASEHPIYQKMTEMHSWKSLHPIIELICSLQKGCYRTSPQWRGTLGRWWWPWWRRAWWSWGPCWSQQCSSPGSSCNCNYTPRNRNVLISDALQPVIVKACWWHFCRQRK